MSIYWYAICEKIVLLLFVFITVMQQREIRELQAEHDRLCKVLSGAQAHD